MALDRGAHADALAETAGLKRQTIGTRDFVLTSYSRITRSDKPIDVYIEGDGLAWISQFQPSLDPTPRKGEGLALAAVDPAPNVVYLARPCQFTPMAQNSRCEIPYWTSKRFSAEVVRSVGEALDDVATRAPGQGLNLVGYSGGAAIAVLVAARRTDVASIRTVAGNLDVEYVNRLHDVSPMPESLNPIDFAASVAAIPQVHFSSTGDEIVPPAVAKRFTDAVGARCARLDIVDGLEHEGDWSRMWRSLLERKPTCTRADF